MTLVRRPIAKNDPGDTNPMHGGLSPRTVQAPEPWRPDPGSRTVRTGGLLAEQAWGQRPERPASGYNGGPMRLLLQQKPLAGEAPKYVQLILQQDLLGGWTLLRETGQIGGKAQLKREQYLERDAALAAFEKARDAQLRKGFQVMFAQGADAPR
jgi:predicted DNA-binding WGR domain protein